MQTAAVVTLAVVAAIATAAGASWLLRPNEPAPGASAAELTALTAQVTSLRQELQQLRAERTAPAAAPAGLERTAVPTISDEQIAAAMQRYLANQKGAAAADASADAPFDVAKAFAELQSQSFFTQPDGWKRAFAAGRMDDLIAMFEQRAAQDPNNVDTQMQLANAYLAYLQMDSSKWQLSMKADSQFDKVLAIDERHWGARFTKAVSYTFWPDFLGKKKDAIANFERLVEQQDSMPVQADQAQTYVYLGNLLEQRNEPEKARAVWQRGLRRHPDNAELRAKAGN